MNEPNSRAYNSSASSENEEQEECSPRKSKKPKTGDTSSLSKSIVKAMTRMNKNVSTVITSIMQEQDTNNNSTTTAAGARDNSYRRSDRITAISNAVQLVEDLERRIEKIDSMSDDSAGKELKLRATKLALNRAIKLALNRATKSMCEIAEESDGEN